ncbi:hypothetical protein M2263_004606 [Providencia alcalifaciens]|nr:hypothetical protein [Providencia alcalifaciens]
MIANGIAIIKQYDNKETGIFNGIIGFFCLIGNIILMLNAKESRDYVAIAQSMLFTFTYIFLFSSKIFHCQENCLVGTACLFFLMAYSMRTMIVQIFEWSHYGYYGLCCGFYSSVHFHLIKHLNTSERLPYSSVSSLARSLD